MMNKENAPQQVKATDKLSLTKTKNANKGEDKKEKKVKDEDKTDWTPALEELLLGIYSKEIISLGKGAPDGGCLKTQSWNKVWQAFIQKSGKTWAKSVLTSKMAGMKTQYVIFSTLK
jgi:hypothetical protein